MNKWTQNWFKNFCEWFVCPSVPTELKDPDLLGLPAEFQVTNLKSSQDLPEELRSDLQEAFLAPLAFGTAGLRGKMGVGVNRMNVYTVAAATQGVAAWLLETYGTSTCKERGVVIGFDTRNNSQLFAQVAACVLAGNGITAHLFDSYCQTPMLAFAVRPLQALAGIMVTASHNPKIYNGYKLYGADGIQIGQTEADAIAAHMGLNFSSLTLPQGLEEGLIRYVPESLQNTYIEKTIHLFRPAIHPEDLKIAYTPVHGTGGKLVLPLLRLAGFTQVFPVEEQLQPDGNFPTAPAPNPEFPEATALLKALAEEKEADLALATDPDADRLALLLPDEKGVFHQLTGNQTGALLAHFWFSLLKELGTMPAHPALVKSIVTDDFGARVAAAHGVHTEEALTGFKDICGKIREFEEKGSYTYIMGYEESIGFALGDNVLDKDGCSAALALCHAADHYRQQGLTLWQVLQSLFAEHGYIASKALNLVREGARGVDLMRHVMERYRLTCPLAIDSVPLKDYDDLQKGFRSKLHLDGSTRVIEDLEPLSFRTSNVLRYRFEDGSWYAVRPSGTEPKLKVYIYAPKPTEAEAKARVASMEKTIVDLLDQLEAEFNQLHPVQK